MKPTDRNNLLRYNSHHPKAMIQSLLYSQLLRVKRLVEDPSLAEKRLDEMCLKFTQRAYPRPLIQKHRVRVKGLDRHSLLADMIRPSVEPRITFISTHLKISNQIWSAIRREWHILGDTLQNIDEFKNPPRMAYRRPNNLKDRLVKADIGRNIDISSNTFKAPRKGCFPCLRCGNCGNLQRGDRFTHPITGEQFQSKYFLTCNTHFVIYILQCPCNMLYVGEMTMACRIRLNKHKSVIRTGREDLPVPKHFKDKGHTLKDLTFFIIDHIMRLRRVAIEGWL